VRALDINEVALRSLLHANTEPFVLTGGGPGNSTTFLSQFLATAAVGRFDIGPAAAFSIVYFLFILLFSWLFYTAITRISTGTR
jgi:glycerol transport system permease protein